MIELRGVSKAFHGDPDGPHALRDVDLTVSDGEIFGIIGMSGAGKSTLIRCINLLERPSSGRIIIDGQDVTDWQGRKLLELRRSMGMIFQDDNLFLQRTVRQNVEFPLEIVGVDRGARRARSDELLELVGLSEKADEYPSRLSGGQQQRVSIARALANHPKVLLSDEATSALDALTTDSILRLLKNINRELGVTIILITHEMSVVEKVCDKVAIIDDSRIIEQGTVAEVFADPKNDITRYLLGKVAWNGL